jgi:hypothetical protein
MGYRAHVNRKRIIEYDDGEYNHGIEELGSYLEEACGEDPSLNIRDDAGFKDEWEIGKAALHKAIAYTLENYYPEEVVFGDYTADDLVLTFERWMKISSNKENYSCPDFVYVSWF